MCPAWAKCGLTGDGRVWCLAKREARLFVSIFKKNFSQKSKISSVFVKIFADFLNFQTKSAYILRNFSKIPKFEHFFGEKLKLSAFFDKKLPKHKFSTKMLRNFQNSSNFSAFCVEICPKYKF